MDVPTSASDPPGQPSLTPRTGAYTLAKKGCFVFLLHWPVDYGAERGCSCKIDAGAFRRDGKLRDAKQRCQSPGKHPINDGWQDEATTDPDTIRAWFAATPDANYGIALGRSKLVVLDADVRADFDGRDTIRALEAQLGEPLPRTWTFQTGSGGLHYVFDYQGDAKFVGSLAAIGVGPRVDVKAGGGLIVGPGSWHVSGRQYLALEGEDGICPWSREETREAKARPVPLPDAVRDLLAKKPGAAGGAPGPVMRTLLAELFTRAGMVRQVSGDVIGVYCPWSEKYTPGGHDVGNPSSTVLFGAMPGSRVGGFLCDHKGKCPNNRTGVELHAWFAERFPELLPQADLALDGQGIEPLSTRPRPARKPRPEPATNSARPEPEAGPAGATVTQGAGSDPEPTYQLNGGNPAAVMLRQDLAADGVRFVQPKNPKANPVLIGSTGNLALLLQVHPDFAGTIATNQMTSQIVVRRDIPAFNPVLSWPTTGQVLEDPRHYAVLAAYLETVCRGDKLAITPNAPLHKAVKAVADMNAYSPLADMIANLPPWDGVARLHRWVTDVLHVEDPTSNRMGELWLAQAVARVLQPGCQADSVLILEGDQGIGKDQLIRAMNDPFPHVDLGSVDKNDEAARRCHTTWIVSAGEVVAFRRKDIDRLKSYITNSNDLLRRFYSEQMVFLPRRFVLIGTTNRTDYLSDTSGNRRFMPIACPKLPIMIDVARFKADRDQLYAEAVRRYQEDVPWWPNAVEAALFRDIVACRVPDDDWLPLIRRLLVNRLVERVTANERPDELTDPYTVSLSEFYDTDCLNMLPERRNPDSRRRIVQSLTQLGWRYSNKVGRDQGRDSPFPGVRGWLKPEREPGEDDVDPEDPF